MIHGLKIFGLCTLVAAVAGAGGASAASAVTHVFHSESKVTYGAAEALNEYMIKGTPGDNTSINCASYSTESVIEGEELKSITFKPILKECIAIQGETKVVAYVETTGCFIVVSGETVGGNPTEGEHAPASVECEQEGEHIHTKVTAFKFKCRTVPAQTSMGLRFENHETEGVKDVIVDSTIHDGIVTTENSLACPTESGGTEVHNAATAVGEVRITGYSDEGRTKPTGVWFE